MFDYNKIVTVDVECYKNYFLVMFRLVASGKTLYFEKFNEGDFNRQNLLHILNKYTIVTFNGIKYDQLMMEAAIAGFNNKSLKDVSDMLIEKNMQPWQVRKQIGIAALDIDHIDLIEVAPLSASLKIYGGRLHSPKMQDLPIEPSATITEDQVPLLRKYCGNDLDVTERLFKQLEPELELRTNMSKEYHVDLRSKSDAQIAEAVIKKEMDDKYGFVPKRPKVEEGTRFKYRVPDNLVFDTDILQELFRLYKSAPIVVDKSGYTDIDFNYEETQAKTQDDFTAFLEKAKKPTQNKWNKIITKEGKGEAFKQWLKSIRQKQYKFEIGSTKYTAGIGGLHSCEKGARHVAEDGYILRDIDVASYYPRIILNNRLYPKHIGEPFLDIYNSIVERRLAAKRSGDKVTNESLKITINGSFGKLGSKWSCLYSPDLMLQVTVTGQLTLLMLIERLELAGIPTVSANTDGIVIKHKESESALADSIIEDWEFDTDYELEATQYLSLNSRDVNNYIAVKTKGTKGKGAYADTSEHYYRLRSNPTNEICTIAAKAYLQDGTKIEETIHDCKDITKFLSLRTVNGGAVKDGQLIGKAIRWYYGCDELDAIYYKTSGNKVPVSDGGVPLMDLPDEFPSDVDYEWYVNEAYRILKDIGVKL